MSLRCTMSLSHLLQFACPEREPSELQLLTRCLLCSQAAAVNTDPLKSHRT